MVATRRHPSAYTEPSLSPSKATHRATTPTSESSPSHNSASSALTNSLSARKLTPKMRQPKPSSSISGWSHTPSPMTLIWLSISLPLVLWDTGYVLLRPHSMLGGTLHAPIWSPYAYYGTVDYQYGLPAWTSKDGFTGAQGWMNAVETSGYLVYLWMWWTMGERQESQLTRRLEGRAGGLAVIIGLSMSIMTLSKTVLYWLVEYHSGFAHIGHNDAMTLLISWIIPK
ncbi:hypothetical protein K402DRAFT_253505 [Aulographum hederae CBS 113979]|uniref:C6 transcription factor n=1 Tax=Aulographum hederae CBS 113979 TaxID=1176131 RepID=A0A6G1GJ84_9PEZI|nr:hypothetical protein K402DRAFT_253505 [Aulographum hederae CBS 113979]